MLSRLCPEHRHFCAFTSWWLSSTEIGLQNQVAWIVIQRGSQMPWSLHRVWHSWHLTALPFWHSEHPFWHSGNQGLILSDTSAHTTQPFLYQERGITTGLACSRTWIMMATLQDTSFLLLVNGDFLEKHVIPRTNMIQFERISLGSWLWQFLCSHTNVTSTQSGPIDLDTEFPWRSTAWKRRCLARGMGCVSTWRSDHLATPAHTTRKIHIARQKHVRGRISVNT